MWKCYILFFQSWRVKRLRIYKLFPLVVHRCVLRKSRVQRKWKMLRREARSVALHESRLGSCNGYWNGFAFQINTVRGSKWSIMTHFILRRVALPVSISCFSINRGNAFGHQSVPRYLAPRFQRIRVYFAPILNSTFIHLQKQSRASSEARSLKRNTCKQCNMDRLKIII